MLAACTPDFLASDWSSGFGRFLQVSALASHWLKDCANFMPTPEENDQYNANHSYRRAIQACHSTFIIEQL
jgi:hypothetical protein